MNINFLKELHKRYSVRYSKEDTVFFILDHYHKSVTFESNSHAVLRTLITRERGIHAVCSFDDRVRNREKLSRYKKYFKKL